MDKLNVRETGEIKFLQQQRQHFCLGIDRPNFALRSDGVRQRQG
jgi:hypothetical protein